VRTLILHAARREPKRVALRMNVFFISKELLRRGPAAESDVCMRRICGGVVQEIAKGFSPGAVRAIYRLMAHTEG
jgi:hypothetical protein